MESEVRGAHNLISDVYDLRIKEDAENCLKDLESGEIEISRRNKVSVYLVTF